MTDQRPKLNRAISLSDFRNCYWLKAELVDFCRANGLSTSGGKPLVAERIAHFLQTGEELPMLKTTPKATSSFDWNRAPLSLDTIVTDSYKNTEQVRAFFRDVIGKRFKFNVRFIHWMKANAGKTLRDAVEEWLRLEQEGKSGLGKTEIGAQFEYNRYVRDFLSDNPTRSLADARRAWVGKRKNAGSMRYHSEDLQYLK